MPLASSLRFRLILDVVKQVIFLVDRCTFAIPLPRRSRGSRAVSVPELGSAVQILSASRRLAGWFVEAEGPAQAAVLLCHGIGDRTHYWRRAQQRLAQSGISSLVFAYSGYPGSEGATTPENLKTDAHAAYAFLHGRVDRTPIHVMGFSLGTGLVAEVAGSLQPQPAGIILSQGFTSLREAARRMVRPADFMRLLLPDVWKTRENVARLRVPLLVIHSRGDRLFPAAMAEEVAAAAGSWAELKMFAAYAHNAAYLQVPEDYWDAVVEFIRRQR